MSRETLYLVLERRERLTWKGHVRIARIARTKPDIKVSQALVRVDVQIPDDALRPLEIRLEIKPEHIQQHVVTVQSQQP